jgi:non-heme chloroperoxidase
MPTITTKDGTKIFYKDWGSGQPIVFSHAWPSNADSWDEQLFFFASHGCRAIAYDRRGHGRSSQMWAGNDEDTFADDLAALVESLDTTAPGTRPLKNVILVGHSMGGGDVARYIGRYGAQRVAKAVLVGATPPLMVKTPDNPEGLPIEKFDKARAALSRDRSQFFKDFGILFYSANRPGSKVSQGMLDQFWLMGMQNSFVATYDCLKVFTETDLREDLKKFDVPTLVIHGDDDQTVPIEITGLRAAKMIKGATLKIYQGAPHALIMTNRDQFNTDLLDFVRQ